MFNHKLSFLYLFKGGVDNMNLILSIFGLLLFAVVSLAITKLAYIMQEKCNNKKIVVFVDIVSFVFFTISGFLILYMNSAVVAAMSSSSSMDYMMIVYARNIIGFIWGLLYSFFVNFRQMDKYLEILKIEQKENLFIWVIILEILLIVGFVKLCHIW